MRDSRPLHWLLLLVVGGLLTFPHLGAHALWDMDEGVNAECGREMREVGTWIVPTFNGELRTAKPVLTYWLQRLAYDGFGVSEWSARLPSALCGLGSLLVTYELGRRLFGATTGLLAGLALASCVQHAVLSHAATPDAPLVLVLTLAFALVWVGQEGGGRGFLVWPGLAVGLAVLAKGPVGLLLPALTTLLYLGWNRELRRLLDRRLVWGLLLVLLVAGPWYALVAAETRGDWPRAFFLNENLNRVAVAQENHSGPVVYYVGFVLALFAPWSSVIGPTLWDAVGSGRRRSPPVATDERSPDARACRFLLCWTLAVLVPFSLARTKLPNYVAPVYPALALLTARFLVRWARGEVTPPRWVWAVVVGSVALTGVGYAVGLVWVSGVVPMNGMRVFPGVEWWAWVGLLPLAAAGAMAVTPRRPVAVAALTTAAVGLVGVLAAGPVLVIDQYKAAKTLVLDSGARDPDRDLRLATYRWSSDNQSLVFYAERRVEPLHTADRAATFLALPRPAILFVPAAVWEAELAARPELAGCVVTVRKYDFYKNTDIVAVNNGR